MRASHLTPDPVVSAQHGPHTTWAQSSEQGHSPGVGEDPINPGVLPLATGVGQQEDILQPVEVLVGGGIAAHQHGLQEGIPFGDGQRALATLVTLQDQQMGRP